MAKLKYSFGVNELVETGILNELDNNTIGGTLELQMELNVMDTTPIEETLNIPMINDIFDLLDHCTVVTLGKSEGIKNLSQRYIILEDFYGDNSLLNIAELIAGIIIDSEIIPNLYKTSEITVKLGKESIKIEDSYPQLKYTFSEEIQKDFDKIIKG